MRTKPTHHRVHECNDRRRGSNDEPSALRTGRDLPPASQREDADAAARGRHDEQVSVAPVASDGASPYRAKTERVPNAPAASRGIGESGEKGQHLGGAVNRLMTLLALRQQRQGRPPARRRRGRKLQLQLRTGITASGACWAFPDSAHLCLLQALSKISRQGHPHPFRQRPAFAPSSP